MDIIRLSSPNWLKYSIAFGTAFFFSFAVLSLFVYDESGVILTIAGVTFFSYMTYRGTILCRYLNSEFELDGSIIRIRSGRTSEQFPLTGARFKFEDTLQILSIYGFSGDLIFAIDYVGQDIEQLREAIQNSDEGAV